MLFKDIHLQGIKSGAVSLAFRRWRKVSVKKGSLLKTAVGLVEVVNITTIDEHKITDKDARNAGFENKEQLLKSLRQDDGHIYKVEVRYHSKDPRIELREQATLTDEKYEELKEKLVRLDKYSKQGYWTEKILLTIKSNTHKKAIELSQLTGYSKEWLKLNIRKLKNSGLTISHNTGYELSALGKAFVEKLINEK